MTSHSKLPPYQISAYLAARYSRRDELREYAAKLRELRVDVTSRWLEETGPLSGGMDNHSEEFFHHTCYVDLEDVLRANILIFFNESSTVGVPRGGRHVEFGYALAWNKPIFTIGEKNENVFHFHDNVLNFPTFQKFLEYYFYN